MDQEQSRRTAADAAAESGQLLQSGCCLDLRSVAELGTQNDGRGAVGGEFAVERLDGGGCGVFEGEGPEARAEIGNALRRDRFAAAVDEGGGCAVERKRTVLGNGKVERRLGGRKRNLVAEDRAVLGNDGLDRIAAGNPASQAPAFGPVRSDRLLIVETEPTRPAGRGTLRVPPKFK